MTHRTHLVTGGTGFVGGALIIELLDRTDDRLLSITRSDGSRSAGERLTRALEASALAYGRADLIPAIAERCSAVEADLMLPDCGVDAGTLGQIDHFWHCAASLEYKDQFRDDIWATNVGGTSHALELAKKLNDPAFVYVSTAYVAGDRRGDVAENSVEGNDHLNNWYERSKVAAEALVENSGLGDWRIARPTVVIGHSQTRNATSFTGMYGFLRELLRFERKVKKELGSFLSYRPLRIIGEPECLLNFIPVDAVAHCLVKIGLASAGGTRHFHIANQTPPPMRDAIATFFEAVDFAPPQYVPDEEYLTSLDERLNKELDFYRSYLRASKTFLAESTLRYVDVDRLTWDLAPAELSRYANWYVGRFKRKTAVRA
jgi:nucleoside-diphosphate-sugar epimerase